MIDYNIEKELRPSLSSNERLIWTGKPKSGLLLRSSDAFLIPFSLIWGGFVVFWEIMVINMGAPFFFTLFGIPFILIGLYLTIGRFFIDAKKRANTFYGITNDRILIKTGIFNSEINSINIQTLPEITYNQKADQSGTIILGSKDYREAMMKGMELPNVKQSPSLELIENVKTVYNKIIDLQKNINNRNEY